MKIMLFIKLYRYPDVAAAMFLWSLKQEIWKKSVIYFLSPQY